MSVSQHATRGLADDFLRPFFKNLDPVFATIRERLLPAETAGDEPPDALALEDPMVQKPPPVRKSGPPEDERRLDPRDDEDLLLLRR
jgi:hypothetical protein